MFRWEGSKLRDLRCSRGLSLHKLVRLCWEHGFDITPASISFWEQNKTTPRGEHLVALAKIFDVSPEYFLVKDK